MCALLFIQACVLLLDEYKQHKLQYSSENKLVFSKQYMLRLQTVVNYSQCHNDCLLKYTKAGGRGGGHMSITLYYRSNTLMSLIISM
jgi:hypothetical protein